ncbi:hypothetical protein GGX14DRAFT_442623 [Mycena pura]|uniref:Uncharacterized protein n=1 Tax=Mycena pura TaxID=153505 RepID=A0AAD6YIG6_9AGAR|nr:hypothetical protein GGX14DRAFT_442623 [Mycena pura]
MHFLSTSLLAILATSVLTTAAPLHLARANNNDLAQFAVACSTVGVAGNLTFQAIGLLQKIQTDDKNVAGQLNAINVTLNTAFNSGETARPVCEAPDPNNLATQFVTACDAINIAGSLTGTTITLLNQIETDDQNVAGQVDVLKATMNGVNTAGQVANGVCEGINTGSNANNNAESSSSSTSTTLKATQSSSASRRKQSK